MMFDNSYIYKKEVDWSLLNEGFSIPLDTQIVFQKNMNHFIQRGESKTIILVLEGTSYNVLLKNQAFNEQIYPTHKDILQIRYNPQSDLANKLRDIYTYSHQRITEFRDGIDSKIKKRMKAADFQREFMALYTTDTDNTFLVECMTNAEKIDVRKLLLNEDEQTYEISVNYNIYDPFATIESVQKLTKMRKLNRAIGDNLKMLYDYKCQICGHNFGKNYDANIVEAHHLVPFVVSMNNDAYNQIIICPNHHRVIHNGNPVFDIKRMLFSYQNGLIEKLVLNRHLKLWGQMR